MLPTCEPQDTVLLRFEGRLDAARCTELEPDVHAAVAQPKGTIVFDLEKVDFVSSAFLRLCIYAWQKSGERGFQVVHAAPPIRRVFKIAGLDNWLRGE